MLRFVTIHHPAQTLSSRRQESLCRELLTLNLLLSESEMFHHGWHERIGTFMADTDLLDLVYDRNELVGHYSSRQVTAAGDDVTYIDTYTVHPRLQRSGLGTWLAIRMAWHGLLRARGIGFVLASRTEAPHVAASIWAGIGTKNYYPSFTPTEPPELRLAAIAASLAQQEWPGLRFVPETGVLEGAYGGPFLPPMPTHHARVQAHFERHVSPERGDALVQVIWYRRSAWLHMARQFSARMLRVSLGQRRGRSPSTARPAKKVAPSRAVSP